MTIAPRIPSKRDIASRPPSGEKRGEVYSPGGRGNALSFPFRSMDRMVVESADLADPSRKTRVPPGETSKFPNACSPLTVTFSESATEGPVTDRRDTSKGA